MGYKRIGSAIHNFAHSFFSLMNYFEGEYIIDILGDILRRLPEGELRIIFPGGAIEPGREYPKPLLASVAHYDRVFASHLTSENVAQELVSKLELIVVATKFGLSYGVEAVDDRGEIHGGPVAPA